MLSNVGHTIQGIINNVPVAIAANDVTTTIATNGGSVFQAGLVGQKIQAGFQEIVANENIVGKVIDVEAGEREIYLLNSAGAVFAYDFNADSCSPIVREIYTPSVCSGDKAIKIDAGRDHVVILTEKHKVFGAGDNSQYQLVPQGQCRYDIATELIVTDTITHDNTCCERFVGTYNRLTQPVIPNAACGKVSCIRNNGPTTQIGTVTIPVTVNVPVANPCGPCTTTPFEGEGVQLVLPVVAEVTYSGFLCTQCDSSCVSGTITYTITSAYIPAGCRRVTVSNGLLPPTLATLNISISGNIPIVVTPLTGTVPVTGQCGGTFTIADLATTTVLTAAVVNGTIQISAGTPPVLAGIISIVGPCGSFASAGTPVISALALTTVLDCCVDRSRQSLCCDSKLPQPCWANVYAGFDISVLVDQCNRLYVLGSLHTVRNNAKLLKKGCLEDILNKTVSTVSFPADQLNCSVKHRTGNCKCNDCPEKPFKTDLSKFGVQLCFNNGCCDSEGFDNGSAIAKTTNVCDFIKALQRCNDSPSCNNTCEPCENVIHLDISGDCGQCPCPCEESVPVQIASVTLYNRRSICKLISQGVADTVAFDATIDSLVEFDINRYCVDAVDVCLDRVIVLNFSPVGSRVNLFVDLDRPGAIDFRVAPRECQTSCRPCVSCNVEFPVDEVDGINFILNFGSILDPVELTNLKLALIADCGFPCPQFKNPFNSKIVNTYLRGGDRVKFVSVSGDTPIRHAVTADVPTVFRLTRRVIDVGVGHNNLSVLVGGLACPNEIYAIGSNCSGELGLNSYESTVCFRQVNRCLFDCQVNAIFSGKGVTFYLTQSGHVFAAGQWKCFVDSTIPTCLPCVSPCWKVSEIAISKNHIVLLSSEGSLYGIGENSLGELGLCHTDCVGKFVPISFFYKINQCYAKKLCDGLAHPVERKQKCCEKSCERSCEKPEPEECIRYSRYTPCPVVKKYIPNGRCCRKYY